MTKTPSTEIAFTKYEKYGAYHWRQYVKGTKYRRHVDYICSWVSERPVLDVGAGDGLITYLLGAKGIEVEEAALKQAEALKVDVSYGNAYDLRFEDDSFGAVTMIDVIEHFGDPGKALAEAKRVAPVLYIATPERGMVNDPFHIQEWTRDELPDFMAEHGWKITGDVAVKPEHKSMYAKFVRYE